MPRISLSLMGLRPFGHPQKAAETLHWCEFSIHLIPKGCGKRKMERYYLKWENDVIGVIYEDLSVQFISPEYNRVVSLYTGGKAKWSSAEFLRFLEDRIVSRSRRDIERILFRCGLMEYTPMAIALKTRAIHAGDLLWVTMSPDESMADAVTEVFQSIFHHRIDLAGDTLDTPEGVNIKRYGVFNGQYGIYKKRLSPLLTDAESEIAVPVLAERLGVPCCRAYRAGRDEIFSVFEYDFSREYIVHMRYILRNRTENLFSDLLTARSQYSEDIAHILVLDFVTRQEDRHLSNLAVKLSGDTESLYPLYDNGRSLFYEDTEETVREAVENIPLYASTFGSSGTCWDHLVDLSEMGMDFGSMMNLYLSDEEIREILESSGFTGYRLEGATLWIARALGMVRSLPSYTPL